MPNQEVEQQFVITVKGYGDPEKLRSLTLTSLASALHYSFLPGCQIADDQSNVWEFNPKTSQVDQIGEMDWAAGRLMLND